MGFLPPDSKIFPWTRQRLSEAVDEEVTRLEQIRALLSGHTA
jgi:hypothetical protein